MEKKLGAQPWGTPGLQIGRMQFRARCDRAADGCGYRAALRLIWTDGIGAPTEIAELCNRHARGPIEAARAADLRIFDDR